MACPGPGQVKEALVLINEKRTNAMIIDTHAHYDDKAFDEDRDMLLSQLPSGKIQLVVNIGASIRTTKNTLELMSRYPFVYGAVGVHPSETGELTEPLMDWLQEAAGQPKVVAVGEIGLDYYWDAPGREIQKAERRRSQKPCTTHSPPAVRENCGRRNTEKRLTAEHTGTHSGICGYFST